VKPEAEAVVAATEDESVTATIIGSALMVVEAHYRLVAAPTSPSFSVSFPQILPLIRVEETTPTGVAKGGASASRA
jgi:hypothetical protein